MFSSIFAQTPEHWEKILFPVGFFLCESLYNAFKKLANRMQSGTHAGTQTHKEKIRRGIRERFFFSDFHVLGGGTEGWDKETEFSMKTSNAKTVCYSHGRKRINQVSSFTSWLNFRSSTATTFLAP